MLTNIILKIITRNVSSLVSFIQGFDAALHVFLATIAKEIEEFEEQILGIETQIADKKKEANIVSALKNSLPKE